MDACEVKVELKRETRAYAPAESVAGTVFVMARTETALRRIAIAWDWRARAGPVTEAGPRAEIELSGPARLKSGESRAYSFRFPAPSSPFSYHGRLINVDWRLVAIADHDRRSIAETPFSLVPGESASRSPYEWEHNRERTRQPESYASPSPPPLVWIIGVLGAVFLTAGGLLVFRALIGASTEAFQLLVVGVIVLAFGLLGVWQVFAAARARRTASAIAVVISTPEVRANETLRVALEVPANSASIHSARLVLLCEEEVLQNPARKEQAASRHVVRETEIARSDAPAAPGQPLRLLAAVRVPAGSPLSFQGKSISVKWRVEARLSLPFAPDFRTRTGFIVRP